MKCNHCGEDATCELICKECGGKMYLCIDCSGDVTGAIMLNDYICQCPVPERQQVANGEPMLKLTIDSTILHVDLDDEDEETFDLSY